MVTGAFNCREAINRAIHTCSKAGGGRVVIPGGVWLTGAIRLKSNVNLHVSKGATVNFATDAKAYMPLVHTRWEGMELIPRGTPHQRTVTGKGFSMILIKVFEGTQE